LGFADIKTLNSNYLTQSQMAFLIFFKINQAIWHQGIAKFILIILPLNP